MNTNQIKQWLQALPQWVSEVPVCNPATPQAWGCLLHFTGTSNTALPIRITYDSNRWRYDNAAHSTVMNVGTVDMAKVSSKRNAITTFLEDFQAAINA